MEAATTKDPDSSKANRRIMVAFLGAVLWSIFCTYLVFYWGLYRGGAYVWSEWMVPLLATRGSFAFAQIHGSDYSWMVWSTFGACAGLFAAVYVRRWLILRTLRGKLVLLSAVRDNILAILEKGGTSGDGSLAVEGGSVKFLFGEAEYAQLARYLEPQSAITVLRTVSAIDLLAAAGRTTEAKAEIARIETDARDQLKDFVLYALVAELRLFRRARK
ncbi:hypothetical protein Q4S45_11640 [Massilia sp. R2A-15]|uniref:hypothetical protein n=1 Tax=Massilia sp. R2A-15 TaxID=3064278 RepID=UPI00273687A4|nr:hypothetical protein [Massilia sp. R2A-15]WLI87400.1 hypothetical protein Q4S45_11640 [Massilia sp. R2A-15]